MFTFSMHGNRVAMQIQECSKMFLDGCKGVSSGFCVVRLLGYSEWL